MRVILFFVDGIGLGEENLSNPFYLVDTPNLEKLLDGKKLTASSCGFTGSKASLLSLDAALGMKGLPQSATGQAAIFTGQNAPCIAGEHISGYPNKILRDLLAEQGMFLQFRKRGYSCCFANAYRPVFFEMLELGLPGYSYSCSTLVTFFGGLTFYSLADLKKETALYMDITGEILLQSGFKVPLISPEEGGRRLAQISKKFDFTLFEYFLSDLAGHAGSAEEAEKVVSTLDRFVGALASALDDEDALVLITSDHGNLEDLSVRGHTLNRVPLLLYGSPSFRKKLVFEPTDLTGLLPFIKSVLCAG